jgi:hypothetical protein
MTIITTTREKGRKIKMKEKKGGGWEELNSISVF